MSNAEARVLRKNYAFLTSKLDPVALRTRLYAEQLLTEYEYAEIQAQSVAPLANELILAALKRRAPGYLERLCLILEEDSANQYVANKLREGKEYSDCLVYRSYCTITFN